jgi:hypothetical protein
VELIPEFADNIRIRVTPVTKAAGIAGALGQVMGFTTPSVTGVQVIGDVAQDYALAIMLEGRDEALWLTPELVELVDHAPGTEIRLDGVSKRSVRLASGDWIDEDVATEMDSSGE